MNITNRRMEPRETLNKGTVPAFITGLLSIFCPVFCILPIIGIIICRMSLIQCQMGRANGYRLAKAGLICSYIGLAIGIFSIIMLVIGLVFYATVT